MKKLQLKINSDFCAQVSQDFQPKPKLYSQVHFIIRGHYVELDCLENKDMNNKRATKMPKTFFHLLQKTLESEVVLFLTLFIHSHVFY